MAQGSTKKTVVQATAADLNMTEASAADIKTAVELIDDTVQTEDAVGAGGEKGVFVLGRRDDGKDSSSVSATGDYQGLEFDDRGCLKVNPNIRTELLSTGELGAVDDFVGQAARGAGNMHWQITGGDLVGTVVFEAALDNTNWYAIKTLRFDGSLISSTTTFPDRGVFASSGHFQVRLRVSSYTSGSSTGRLRTQTGGPGLVRTLAMGDIAHDGVDSGPPLKMGHKAIAHGANPTAVAAGDRTDWYASIHGVPFVIGGHPHVQTFEYNTTGAQEDDSILGAISDKLVITMIDATCDNANTNDTGVRIGFGDTVVPAEVTSGDPGVGQIVLSHPGIAAGSGVVKGNGSGIIAIGGAGKELRITNDDPGGKLRVLVTLYLIES